MRHAEHKWKERPAYGGTRWAGYVEELAPAWEQCTRCGLSRGMAEHLNRTKCPAAPQVEDTDHE